MSLILYMRHFINSIFQAFVDFVPNGPIMNVILRKCHRPQYFTFLMGFVHKRPINNITCVSCN
jgi:hypothetical protein